MSSEHPFDHLLQRHCLSREIHFETFIRWVAHDTSYSKLALQEETLLWQTMHRCFPLKIYHDVAMVTIQEVLLWLPAVITISLNIQYPKFTDYRTQMFIYHIVYVGSERGSGWDRVWIWPPRCTIFLFQMSVSTNQNVTSLGSIHYTVKGQSKCVCSVHNVV